MKTSVLEVHAMLSVLSVDDVEKRIGEVPGVESVTVNFAAGSATVRYDEPRLMVADIKSAARQRGHESAAPASATPEDTPPGAPATPAPTPASVPTSDAPPAPPAGKGHEGHAEPGAPPTMSADIAHEMGHSGTGRRCVSGRSRHCRCPAVPSWWPSTR
jgi:Cu2+-exporting ATPase